MLRMPVQWTTWKLLLKLSCLKKLFHSVQWNGGSTTKNHWLKSCQLYRLINQVMNYSLAHIKYWFIDSHHGLKWFVQWATGNHLICSPNYVFYWLCYPFMGIFRWMAFSDSPIRSGDCWTHGLIFFFFVRECHRIWLGNCKSHVAKRLVCSSKT